MTRTLLLSLGLLGTLTGSFVGCGGGDSSPIGDTLDGSARSSSGSRNNGDDTFDDTATSSGDRPSGSSSSGGGTICSTTFDCPPGQECIATEDSADGEGQCQGDGGASSSGSSSGGSSSSSGSNPGGKALGEPCGHTGETAPYHGNDAECESNICVTSKNTGEFYCSKTCDKPDNSTCPSVLPRCGDEPGYDHAVCRADI